MNTILMNTSLLARRRRWQPDQHMKMFCISHRSDACIPTDVVIPVFVGQGHACHQWLRDDVGDNIHHKNPMYCELTGQYWVWKNVFPSLDPEDVVGFCHYRRFFTCDTSPIEVDESSKSLRYTKDDLHILEQLLRLSGADAIISKAIPTITMPVIKKHYKKLPQYLLASLTSLPWRLSVYNNYALCHSHQDLEIALTALPASLSAGFRHHLKHNTAFNPGNAYIGSVSVLSAYFNVLFDWLGRCEQILAPRTQGLHVYQKRAFGFLAERFASFYFSSFVRTTEIPFALVRELPHRTRAYEKLT